MSVPNSVRVTRSPVRHAHHAYNYGDIIVKPIASTTSPTKQHSQNTPPRSTGGAKGFLMSMIDAFSGRSSANASPTKTTTAIASEDSSATLFSAIEENTTRSDDLAVSSDSDELLTVLPRPALLSLPPKPNGLISGPTPLPEGESEGGMDPELRVGPYNIIKVLGQGTFGKVKLGQHHLTKASVAIKVIDKKSIKTNKQRISVDRELRLMKLLHHDHIVEVLDVFKTKAHYFVVMEHANGGELFEYIVQKGKLPEEEARRFFRQLILAMNYCHKNSVLHRDLKPENLLLDRQRNIKIIDFGFGNTFHKDRLLDTFCGSPFYAAPEMIQGIKYTGPEVDVWSMGVILYALLSGRLPFDAATMTELYQKIARGQYSMPSYFSPEVRDLVSKMLDVNRHRRLTLDQIMQHPWVKRGDNGQLLQMSASAGWENVTTEPNEDSLNELVSYGFNAADARRMLAADKAPHPIISLYHLIDKARVRREKQWEMQCATVTAENERRVAKWEEEKARRQAQWASERAASIATLGPSQTSMDDIGRFTASITSAFERTSL